MNYEMIDYEAVSTTTRTAIINNMQRQYYERDGFLVLKNFIPSQICDSLKNRAETLIDDFEPGVYKAIFSSKNQHQHMQQYFLDSGDKIHFFFEEDALSGDGDLMLEKRLCINKIGHALHDLDPVFYCFSRLHKIAAAMEDINIKNPRIVQSMYICKQPHVGGEVQCHQDSTYLFVKEQPITGFWFALEDATLQNGCLWAIPGGHRTKLKSRMFRENYQTYTKIFDDTPWPEEKMIPLEVPRGSLIILHGLLPHRSKSNQSSKSRHAYTLHVMSEEHEFAADNWLQRTPENPFPGVL